ncbi:alpha-amylase family glycosyl hydrolase [Rubrivirga marina]|uniref:Alpha-amylase n=1 Tax=Rubrivirga marina TaxID=1196024 RepID=A0A271IVX8_9BACT|nr:alpha-amylase family glycosyl hydrolase [Rubrivirga marina]PAP75373.1 alpha-amylase [Rubrivirga marina]
MTEARPWWQTGVIYQVYPRSFQDSDGDGVGDLEGVRQRLDYLVWLGVDALWLSPFYPSPMADFGYDVADYCGVDPLFGDLDAFDRLVADAHARGLRLILDWVPNHSSDRHPWFEESRRSRDSPKRDWYVWRDLGPDGALPNNWLSAFGGPAWTLDEATGQVYLHSFLKEQPDLNWRSPALREAMLDTLRFWMARGVDGFRIDVAHHVLKDPALRDNPPNPAPSGGHKPASLYDAQLHVHDKDHPDAHALYREVRTVVDGFDDRERVTLGEIHLPNALDRWAAYYGGPDLDEIHMPLNFGLLDVEWSADGLRRHVEAVEAAVPEGAWPNYVLGNHDERRLATRLGPERARLAALLLLTLRGTPTLYYGDELGVPDVAVPADRIRDPMGLRSGIPALGRDSGRTPMAWDASPSAGFSTAPPDTLWLPLHAEAERLNVSVQRDDPESLLSLYRSLLALRRRRPALYAGRYTALGETPASVFAFERQSGTDRVVVVLNLGDAPMPFTSDRRILSTHPVPSRNGGLRPWEGLVVEGAP